MKTRLWLFTLAVCVLLLLAAPASAAEPGGAAVFGGYWQGFVEYWKAVFKRQNGIVMGILGLGAVALFIITRGKWQK